MSSGQSITSCPQESTFKDFISAYIIQQLRKYGHKQHADRLAVNLQPPSELTYKLVQKISNQLAEEKKEQLEDICYEMQITPEDLQDTFETISKEMFHNSIKWGRVVTFIAFTGALAVYCAEYKLLDQLTSIIDMAHSFTQTNLIQWIKDNDGWTGFVKHFSDQEIDIASYVPQLLIGMSLTALTITGGILAFKRKLFLS